MRQWLKRYIRTLRENYDPQGGWLTAIGIAVSVATAAYAAYSQDQAQAEQYAYQKRNMEMAARQEEAAGHARAAQVQYDIDKRKKTFAAAAAGAGVDIASGSLLESIGRFASEADYSKQLARYPHQLAGQSDQYKADVFNFKSNQASGGAMGSALMAGGSTLATMGAKYGKSFFNSGDNTGYGTGAP